MASAYYHRIFANAITVKLPKQSFLFENSLFVVQVIDYFIQNRNQNFRDFRFVCSLQGLNRVRIISKFRTRSFPGPPPFFFTQQDIDQVQKVGDKSLKTSQANLRVMMK